jgi:hypothetical protein
MIGETNLFGVFLPTLLIVAVLAFALTLLLKWALRRLNFYRLVWHAGLFDTGLFVVTWWLVAMSTTGLTPFLDGAS